MEETTLPKQNVAAELSKDDSANGVYAYLSESDKQVALKIEKLLNGLAVDDASHILVKVRRSILSKSVVRV
jgi:hypothetical protein